MDAESAAEEIAHHREETHRSHRGGWLRAAVLGANDGIVSIASLVVGVAGSGAGRSAVATAGVAGLVGGALSMAVGEYVSVSSQRDAEEADLRAEEASLLANPALELEELTAAFMARGISRELSREVAVELTAKDELAAHAREELGISPDQLARPLQAGVVSAAAFSVGAIVPVATVLLAPFSARVVATIVAALICLAVLGYVGARLGGAPPRRAMIRVLVGSGAAMGLTFAIGYLFGVST
ncbi:MAG: VIT1/CCC1 transporter family protein [Acidimicrobiia bacterium]